MYQCLRAYGMKWCLCSGKEWQEVVSGDPVPPCPRCEALKPLNRPAPSLRALNKALARLGVTDPLYRAREGYYYFGGDALGNDSSVYTANHRHQSIYQWYLDWCSIRLETPTFGKGVYHLP